MSRWWDENNKRQLYEALTRYNYFPNQRESIGEIPPSISSRQFTPEVAEIIAALHSRNSGYDIVDYRSTRYNNVPRVLGLCHPKPYADLVKCIHDNWEKISFISENESSMIKPEFHYLENRIVVMSYGEPTKKMERINELEFSNSFKVNADIANCFGSIYSHAIPWALIGQDEAKAKKDNLNAWYNKLDEFQRKIKRNETNGIPIGSAASSIIVEIMLCQVDTKLREKGYHHFRYVDDYSLYCKTGEEANKFIQDLDKLLSNYKLTLNLRKTSIEELPTISDDAWVFELKSALPSRLMMSEENAPRLDVNECITYINKAIMLNNTTPDGSVLKYAFMLILEHVDEFSKFFVLEKLINLSWHYPVLIPLLDKFLDDSEIPIKLISHKLNHLIIENSEKRRSDGVAWPLHIFLKNKLVCSEEAAEKVLEFGDCVSVTLLLEMKVFDEEIVKFSEMIVAGDDYGKDCYWLLLYQMFRKQLINDPYKDGVFKKLRECGVNFVPQKNVSNYEKKSDRINREMESDAMKKAFSDVYPPLPF
ncbi:MAG: antiviral reverse transcriptase Drt4 [Pseudomonadota bacterium]|uniref:antiviral reverse transcriptase Drt4 n=1 Tax=Gallaecimonas pentaromativorans TaxID=584787 RepID=UPI00067E9021|nr:antiviral reverse transcriptase Drt4 [Gallaecimonas pentaromativorans]MED5524325.1 antiviral reverse transcriptase Drt4 [Pseudomonadota bacterium]